MLDIPRPRNRGRNFALTASFVIHCLVVFVWLHRAPLFVRPSAVAWGMQGQSKDLVYFPTTQPGLVFHKEPIHLAKHTAKRLPAPPQAEPVRAGKPMGSLAEGPANGIEAVPAIPLIFPDPAIFPWQLKNGLKGDVIVEVTIDEQGMVTNTKVLQSLQQDIDEKVMATLREWRFRPAKVDGMAISSRQDVHFHFPS